MSRYKNYMLAGILGGLLSIAPQARSAEMDTKAIEQLAMDAKSKTEHTDVAKQYRLKAQALTAKADKLERGLRQPGPHNPMAVKWPAMVVNARERKERIAMQSRRAAQECLTLAEHHENLAAKAGERTASKS